MKVETIKRSIQEIIDSTLQPSAGSKGIFPNSNEVEDQK